MKPKRKVKCDCIVGYANAAIHVHLIRKNLKWDADVLFNFCPLCGRKLKGK